MPLNHSLPLSAAARRLRRVSGGLLFVAFLALPCFPATAQNNDDDGVLPFTGAKSTSPKHGPGGGPNAAAGNATTVGIAAEPLADTLELTRASLRMHAQSGQVLDAEFEPGPDAAVFAAEPGSPLRVESDAGGGLSLQGSGLLAAPDALQQTLVAAPAALARTAVLLLDDGSASVAELLAGTAQPAVAVVLGDMPAVDLVDLRARVANHSQALAGNSVTIVLVSLDPSGQLQLAAVRFAADPDAAAEVVMD